VVEELLHGQYLRFPGSDELAERREGLGRVAGAVFEALDAGVPDPTQIAGVHVGGVLDVADQYLGAGRGRRGGGQADPQVPVGQMGEGVVEATPPYTHPAFSPRARSIWVRSLAGDHRSSSSRKANHSPLAAAMPALRARATPGKGMADDLQPGVGPGGQPVRRRVGRAVVDHDHLQRHVQLGQSSTHRHGQAGGAVVGGDDHRRLRARTGYRLDPGLRPPR